MPNSCAPAVRASAAVRSEWAMPRPAVIQLTAPGRIACSVPRLSRWMISPSDQIGHRGEPDVRMRAHVDALAEQELRRAHLVEEDERADHLPLCRRQRPAHLETAEIAGPRHDHHLDRLPGLLLVALRVARRLPAHCHTLLARCCAWPAMAYRAKSVTPTPAPTAPPPNRTRLTAGAVLKRTSWRVATRRGCAGRGPGPGPRGRPRSSW